MNRWLAAVGLAATTTVALAQAPTNNKPGYLIIRVKLSDAGGGAGGGAGEGANPGGAGVGAGGYGQSGQGPGMYGGNQGGRPGGPGGPGGGLAGGGLGGPGPLGGFGGGPNTGGTDPESLAKERSIAVLVPYTKLTTHLLYKNKGPNQEKNPRLPYIEHAFGATYLYQDGTSVQIKQDELTNQESEIRAKYKKWAASPSRKADELVLLIEQAFAADLPKLATEYADDLAKMKDATGQAGEFAKAYAELKAKLGNALPTDPAAQSWRAKLGGTATISDEAPHYTLIHFGVGQSLSQDALTRKADLLEENFRTFYTWHALKGGRVLPFPDKKLIVVVARKGGDLTELRGRLDGMKTGEDSFYSQEHNLLVLSPERTDDLGKSFFESARSKSTREGFDRNDLLKGNAPPLRDKLTATEVALASTYALVERMLEVETDKAAITSEGNRQLYAAAGLLPKYVRLPQWMESGIASILQHPKSMGVVVVGKQNEPGLALGTRPGYGAPNNLLLREFQAFYPSTRRKEIKTEEVLRNTILDRYFEAVASTTDLDGIAPPKPAAGGNNQGRPGGGAPGGGMAAPPGIRGPGGFSNDAQNPPPPPPPPGGGGAPGGGASGGVAGAGTGPGSSGIYDSSLERPPLTQAQLLTKAKATAWALTYFLAQKHAAKYHAFLQELNSLPRDLRIDRQVILRRYCRTFDLLDQDGETINEAAFKAHADEWFDFITGLQPSWREVTLAYMTGGNNPSGGRPGGPGGPGGLPGPGGPGGLPGPGSPDGGGK